MTVHAEFETQFLFQHLKENDCMEHQAVYSRLSKIFQTLPPFHLLDIGCADGEDIALALRQSRISSYTGIDSSAEAVQNARKNLRALPCPATILHGDYTEILNQEPGSVDIIWMGLFFHHLDSNNKKSFLKQAWHLLSPHGKLLAHDPVCDDNESREEFLARLEQHARKYWGFLSPEEKNTVRHHWRKHGFQESFSTLRRLSLQAGFSDVQLLWKDTHNFYALSCFQK